MRILVVVAHPDDEVLGCGGTIAMHCSKGEDVFLAILSEGMMAREKKGGRKLRTMQSALKKSAKEASTILGAREVVHFDFPDNRMDSVDLLCIVKTVEECVEKYQPELVYTHHVGDLNIDHAITAKAVITATRPTPYSKVRAVYSFEVLSSTEWAFGVHDSPFKPNHFVSIEAFLEKKVKALEAYQTEIQPFPYPRSLKSIRALAAIRGSQAGLRAAEAFMLVRSILR